MADEDAIVVNDEGIGTDSTPVDQQAIDLEGSLEDSATQETDGEEESEQPTEEKPSQNEEAGDEDQPKPEETQEEPKSKGEQRKEQLNTEIRDLVAHRNKLRQEVESINNQAYQLPTPEQLMEQVNPETGEYYNRMEAQLQAMQQERAIEKYNTQVAEAQLQLDTEAERALRDFPELFKEDSPYKDAVVNATQMLQKSLHIDPRTNQIIGSAISPYELYKTLNDSIQSAASVGQVQAQKAQSEMLANADTTVTQENKVPKKDTFLSGFDAEWS